MIAELWLCAIVGWLFGLGIGFGLGYGVAEDRKHIVKSSESDS